MYSYDKILDIMNTREQSKSEAKKKLQGFRDALNPSDEDFSKAVKIAKKMVKETDKKIIEKFGIEVNAIQDITNFLNRFRASDQILDQIDVSPLTNKTQI